MWKQVRVNGHGVKEKSRTLGQNKEKVRIEQGRGGGTKQRQISKHAKATLPNKNKQNQPTLKRKEHGTQRNDKTLTLKENIIQSTKQNSSAALCTMNQVNENMHSEK